MGFFVQFFGPKLGASAQNLYICRVLLFFVQILKHAKNLRPPNQALRFMVWRPARPRQRLHPEECWNVILAIRECQREVTLEPIKNLPLNIRRGLQMRTLETQILKILEHTGRMSARGAAGGNAAQKAAQEKAKLAAEERERAREEQNKQYEERSKSAISREQYLLWKEKNVLNEMGQPGPNWGERAKYALPETLERWKQWNEQQSKTSKE